MSRKQREREREQQRKEHKRQRAEAAKAVATATQPADVSAGPDPALAQVAAQIADQLGETEAEPREQIERIAQFVGADTALAWLRETLEIEAQGGMWLADGSRRKTPGGIYFKLIQQRVAKTHRLSIFYPDYEQTFPLDEQELTERLAGAGQWPLAAAQHTWFSLVGRPARIAPPDTPEQAPYVVFDLTASTDQTPMLIKGLPRITEPTTYRVFAPTRLWPHIAKALVEQPDAQVAVSGYPAPDPRSPGVIVVYASNIHIAGQGYPPRTGKRAPAAPPQAFATGAVKWFSVDKGFGFITSDAQADVFVHQTALAGGRATLSAGERVYFGVREGRKGPEATDVYVGAPPPPPAPALPTLALPHPAIPARMRLRMAARPPEFAFLGRPNQPPSLIGFRAEAALPRLPDGMPAPAGPTTFLALIALKQWKHVRDRISADAADSLLISGYCSTDRRIPGMLMVRSIHVDSAAQQQTRNAAERQRRAERQAESDQGAADTHAEQEAESDQGETSREARAELETESEY